MADVFLSYAREDRATAGVIADALKMRGWTVWWDRKIAPGLTFEEIIERELTASRCVVVLWSSNSIGSNWVRNEAREALDRGVLVPVLIEQVKTPIAFRHQHAADLIGWVGDIENAEWQEILDRVAALAATENPQSEFVVPRSQTESALVRSEGGPGVIEGQPVASVVDSESVKDAARTIDRSVADEQVSAESEVDAGSLVDGSVAFPPHDTGAAEVIDEERPAGTPPSAESGRSRRKRSTRSKTPDSATSQAAIGERTNSVLSSDPDRAPFRDLLPPPEIAARIGFPSMPGEPDELDARELGAHLPADAGERPRMVRSGSLVGSALILLGIWVVGMVTGETVGGVVHIALLLAAALLIRLAVRSDGTEE